MFRMLLDPRFRGDDNTGEFFNGSVKATRGGMGVLSPAGCLKNCVDRAGNGPEAQASGYPDEALMGCWVRPAGFEPALFG